MFFPFLRADVFAGSAGGYGNCRHSACSSGAAGWVCEPACGSVGTVRAVLVEFLRRATQLVLGPPSGAPREVFSRWKTYPVIGLSLIVIGMSFRLPGPLYQLIDGAARILAVTQ